jgi:hypothetical protein
MIFLRCMRRPRQAGTAMLAAVACMFATVIAGLCSGTALAAETTALDAAIIQLAPPPSEEALAQIPDSGRKLLALRSYIRSGPEITKRWSWTAAEIKAFEGSPEQQALLAEIAAVKAHFKANNPGYEIYVHGTVRSLDEQIAKWNANESVGQVAAEMLASYKAAFGADGSPPATIDAKKLAAWLRGYQPSRRANLAAPGMTLHGRASAIDFQIMKDGQIYAGADTKQVSSVWRAEGWDQKLKASMTAAGPSFSGPLTNPDEPWHYDYSATPAVAQNAD